MNYFVLQNSKKYRPKYHFHGFYTKLTLKKVNLFLKFPYFIQIGARNEEKRHNYGSYVYNMVKGLHRHCIHDILQVFGK